MQVHREMDRPRPRDLGRRQVLGPAIGTHRLRRMMKLAAVIAAVDQELFVEPATKVVLRVMGDLGPREALDELRVGNGLAHWWRIVLGLGRRRDVGLEVQVEVLGGILEQHQFPVGLVDTVEGIVEEFL